MVKIKLLTPTSSLFLISEFPIGPSVHSADQAKSLEVSFDSSLCHIPYLTYLEDLSTLSLKYIPYTSTTHPLNPTPWYNAPSFMSSLNDSKAPSYPSYFHHWPLQSIHHIVARVSFTRK